MRTSIEIIKWEMKGGGSGDSEYNVVCKGLLGYAPKPKMIFSPCKVSSKRQGLPSWLTNPCK